MPEIDMSIANPLDKEGKQLEVTVQFDISPAEEDVGIMSWGVEDATIVAIHNSTISLKAVTDALSATAWDNIEEFIYANYEPNYGDYED